MKGMVLWLLVFVLLYYLPMESLDLNAFQRQTIRVSVQGEVCSPGILELPRDATIQDALDLAKVGADADLSSLNPFARLADGDVIILEAKAKQQKVSINDGTLEELMSIKGIGEKKATAIIAYRTAHGRFQSLDDLAEVKGFGEKSVATLRPYLSL